MNYQVSTNLVYTTTYTVHAVIFVLSMLHRVPATVAVMAFLRSSKAITATVAMRASVSLLTQSNRRRDKYRSTPVTRTVAHHPFHCTVKYNANVERTASYNIRATGNKRGRQDIVLIQNLMSNKPLSTQHNRIRTSGRQSEIGQLG